MKDRQSRARKITAKTLPRLKSEAVPVWYADTSLPGFVVRVLPGGGVYFGVRYSVRATGKRRFVSLGDHRKVTFEKARAKAKEILAAVELGEDPRRIEKAVTWGEWVPRYLQRLDVKRPIEQFRYLGVTPAIGKRGKPTDPTFRDIRAAWAGKALDEITPEDIEAARATVRKGGKIKANRWLAHVAACFAAAVRAELLDRNPAAAGKVKPDRENPGRRRVLTPSEMKALFDAVNEERDPFARAAVLLLALTGARTGELLAATWEDVDEAGRTIRLPDSKSGRPRNLPLPSWAIQILRALPRAGRFVIAGRDPEKPRPDIKRVWRRIAKRAGLVGAAPHDLRRTWSLAVSRVAGVRVASLGLGHESLVQTERAYLPESFGAVLAAAEKVAKSLPSPKRSKR